MANLIQNNSKLIEQQRTQINSNEPSAPTNKSHSNDDYRNPRTVAIIKDQSGFGFNVRGQISGEFKECKKKNSISVHFFNILNIWTKIFAFPTCNPIKASLLIYISHISFSWWTIAID